MKAEQDPTTLKSSLRALDTAQLNHIFNEVLHELRKRESERIKKDVLRFNPSFQAGKPCG